MHDRDSREALRETIADYMEKGFLENIIDMFKYDPSLYSMVGDLIRDDRLRVRIGTTALMEELAESGAEELKRALDSLLPLLKDENPTTRGDAAYLVSLIAGRDSIPYLEPLLNDPVQEVSLLVREIIDELYSSDGKEGTT
jgi:HEAT repeat protein